MTLLKTTAKHQMSYAMAAVAVLGLGGGWSGLGTSRPHPAVVPQAGRMALAPAPAAGTDPVMVVELYTSETCPECPPAEDSMLAVSRAAARAHVTLIPLSFHVAYWNQDGWVDPYSDTIYTIRQRSYNGGRIWTPQVVIDGVTKGLNTSVLQSPAPLPRGVTLEQSKDGTKRTVNIRVAPTATPAAKDSFYVYLAVTEDTVVQRVTGGENSGREFHHVGVVRYFHRIAKIGGGAATLTSVALPTTPVQHGHVSVVVQAKQAGQLGAIVGAGTIPL